MYMHIHTLYIIKNVISTHSQIVTDIHTHMYIRVCIYVYIHIYMYIHICTVGTVYMCVFSSVIVLQMSLFSILGTFLLVTDLIQQSKGLKKKFWYPHKDLCWNVFAFFKSRQVWNRIFFPLPSTKFQILDGSCKKTSNVLHLSWRLCRRGNTKRLCCMSGRVETDRQTDRKRQTLTN